VTTLKTQKLAKFIRIYQAECFPGEVNKMLGKNTGDKVRYLNWLNDQLLILDKMGMFALNLEQFEHLKGTKNPKLYAIRHPHSKINERYLFLFSFGEKTILLTAFKEKNTGDYKSAVLRAENICANLEECHEY